MESASTASRAVETPLRVALESWRRRHPPRGLVSVSSITARTLRTCRRCASSGRSLLIALTACLVASPQACAVTPESPEVIELVNRGLKYLEKKTSAQLGGKCLIGLCYLKAPKKQANHKRVAEALAACQAAVKQGVGNYVAGEDHGVYSNGIALIFLCELDATRYRNEIQFFLDAMQKRQKPHGGWGYNSEQIGDISQTQYGALAYWEAHRRGLRVDPASVETLAHWLTKVQDPSGGWAYKGILPKTSKRVPQHASGSEITCSRTSASMGSALICADLFGLLDGGASDPSELVSLSSALQVADRDKDSKAVPLRSSTLDRKGLFETIRLGDAWMDKNYKVELDHYTHYYMYALERYKSFQEKQTGIRIDEPEWYNKGYEYLKDSQDESGMWESGCGEEGVNDTAFAILFLVRSTQKMLGIGEGTMIGSQGMPSDLTKVKFKDGELVIEAAKTQISELISLIDEQDADLDALIADAGALEMTDLDEAAARRLQQEIRIGEPGVRVLAVRALGRTGDLDYAPTLIYALTDPDQRVVREADTGLRFISRKFGGVGLKERFTDRERFDAIDRWKAWYRHLRPDAIIPTE